MKKSFGIIILAFTLLVSFNAFAQETKLIHSGDYYSVSFDGEGDAIVKAKLNIENLSKESVYDLRLEFPERTTIFKIVQDNAGEPLDFETEFGSEQSIVTVQLENPLEPNSQTALTLLYRSAEVAEKDFLGNLNFDFKTIVNRQAVLTEKARVSVSMQPGFFLKGAMPEIDYKPDFVAESFTMKAASMPAEEFSRYYDNIEGSRGQAVYEGYNLDALESFHVKGAYNWNAWALLANELLVIAAILLVIAIAAVSWMKRKK